MFSQFAMIVRYQAKSISLMNSDPQSFHLIRRSSVDSFDLTALPLANNHARQRRQRLLLTSKSWQKLDTCRF